jgi:hypothetical protein
MNIVKAVEFSWSKTVEEFEKARTNGEAWIWTEDTLRLIFFRHFCQQGLNIESVLAEATYHLGITDYRPDIIIEFLEDNVAKTAVFELKYFNRNWHSDWEKLRLYGVIGWEYGFFLGIGPESECSRIPNFEKQSFFKDTHICELRGLVHPTSPLKYAPNLTIAKDLLEKTLLDTPYIVSNFLGAVAMFEDFEIHFDITDKEGKCVIWVSFLGQQWNEEKLSELGLDRWITFDKEGTIVPSKEFYPRILLGEFEANTYDDNIGKVKIVIDNFMKKFS